MKLIIILLLLISIPTVLAQTTIPKTAKDGDEAAKRQIS